MSSDAAAGIVEGLSVITARALAAGGIFELALLNTTKHTVRGYFDDPATAVKALTELPRNLRPEGCYATLNPIRRELHARAVDRLEPFAKTRAGNDDVLRRMWFAIDADPDRPAGISATDEEVTKAISRIDKCVGWLREEYGWPAPVLASGGNSGHALFAIDEPNDVATTTLVTSVLAVLASRFSSDGVTIDRAVGNAGRIWTVYGTLKRKGDSTPDRPHRRAWIASRPNPLLEVTRAQLEAVAVLAIKEPSRPRSSASSQSKSTILDMADEFRARGWYLRELSGRRHAVTCPWADEHSGNRGPSETVLFEPREADAVWGFRCQHAHCNGRTIRDVWELVRPPYSPNGEARKSAAQATPRDPAEELIVTTVANAEHRRVAFVKDGILARGHLTMVAAAPGLGKTMVSCHLAADQSHKGHVIYLSAEDSVEDTLKPRLAAAGADESRVHVVRGVGVRGQVTRPVSFRDIPLLDEMVRRVNAVGIIVDPIVDMVGDSTNDDKNKELRRELIPFVEYLQSRGLWGLGDAHTNKGSGPAITRILGSMAWVAVPRIVLGIAQDPNDPARRFLFTVKNNLGPFMPTRVFHITDNRLVWDEDTIDLGADELWSQRPVATTGDASSWLRDFLLSREEDGVRSDTVFTEGKEAGFSRDQLYRAKDKLSVIARRRGGLGAGGRWFWILPNIVSTTSTQDSNLSDLSDLNGSKVAKVVNFGTPTRAREESDDERF